MNEKMEQITQALEGLLEGPRISMPVKLIRLLNGDLYASVILSQLLYLEKLPAHTWRHRTVEGLTRQLQMDYFTFYRRAKKLERLGLITYEKRDRHKILKLNIEKLIEALQNGTGLTDTLQNAKCEPHSTGLFSETKPAKGPVNEEELEAFEIKPVSEPVIELEELEAVSEDNEPVRETEPVELEELEPVSEPASQEQARAIDEELIERRKAVFRELEQMGFRIDEELLNEPDPETFSTKLYAIDTNAPDFLKTMLDLLDEIGERHRLAEIMRKYRERYNPRYIPQRRDIKANLKFWDDLEYYINIHTWQKRIAQELGIDYIDYESFTQLSQITAFCIREIPPSKASRVRMILKGWYIYTRPRDIGERAVEEAIDNATHKIKDKATARQY
jgi:DNA-binding transcriptional ArsR family regulator